MKAEQLKTIGTSWARVCPGQMYNQPIQGEKVTKG